MTTHLLRRPLITGLSATLAVRLCAIGLTFIQTLALTRVFGAEVYGTLSLAISVGALTTLALSLGMDQVIMRDLARIGPAHARTSPIWQNTLGQTARAVIPLATVATLAAVCLTVQSGNPAFLAIAISLPLLLARKFLENWVLGAGAVLRSMLASQIVFPVAITLGAATLLLGPVPADLRAAGVLYTTAAFASVTAALILAARAIRQTLPPALKANDLAPLATGRALALVTFGFLASQHIDVLLTGLLSDPTDTALVRVSARVAEMLGLLRMVAVLHFKPKLAAAYGQQNRAQLIAQTRTLTLIFAASGLPLFAASGLPLFAALWLLAPHLLSLFGPEFIAAAPVLRLYLIAVALTLLAGPCTLLLTLCDAEKTAARILWIALAINLILDLILIPRFGAIGCASANIAALATLSVLGILATRRLIGIDPSVLALLRKDPT
ncbi:MAG: polysaccharide biosynthesis C-terminal domain-containing protein [Pseudomonadota bacterium]